MFLSEEKTIVLNLTPEEHDVIAELCRYFEDGNFDDFTPEEIYDIIMTIPKVMVADSPSIFKKRNSSTTVKIALTK